MEEESNMAAIRMLGMASGLPPNIVEQMMEAERIPVKTMEQKKSHDDEKLKLVMFFYVPIFFLALLWKDKSKKTRLFCYVTALWFLIPWFVFSTYKGELTDYYFSSTLYVAIMILAWLSHALWMKKFIVFR